MATFKEVTQPYEVLIRFTNGVVTGAHYQTITTVTRDGVLFGTPVIDAPQQLAAVTGQDGVLLSSVLGENVSSLIKENQDQAVLIAQLKSEIEQLKAQSMTVVSEEVLTE